MSLDVETLAKVVDRRAASTAGLDRLGTAVQLVDELRGQGDLLLDRFVAQARAEGSSWTHIGATLGVSKQAAHQRFLRADGAALSWPPDGTDLVRRALATGQREARTMGHSYLATEHALLGLLAERDGLAAHALAALGVDDAAVRAGIEGRVGTGPARPWAPLGTAPRLKRALEIARSHARSLDHRCMNTEHLLLALVEVSDCVAAEILRDLDVTPDAVRNQVATLLGMDADSLRPRRERRRLRRA